MRASRSAGQPGAVCRPRCGDGAGRERNRPRGRVRPASRRTRGVRLRPAPWLRRAATVGTGRCHAIRWVEVLVSAQQAVVQVARGGCRPGQRIRAEPGPRHLAVSTARHHGRWGCATRSRGGGFRISDRFISPLGLVELGMFTEEAQRLHDLEVKAPAPPLARVAHRDCSQAATPPNAVGRSTPCSVAVESHRERVVARPVESAVVNRRPRPRSTRVAVPRIRAAAVPLGMSSSTARQGRLDSRGRGLKHFIEAR